MGSGRTVDLQQHWGLVDLLWVQYVVSGEAFERGIEVGYEGFKGCVREEKSIKVGRCGL